MFSELLAELDDKFVELDQCFSKLHEIAKRFVKSREGGSAIVIGPKSSGKRSVIRKVVLDYAADMEVVFIDGLIQTSDADALKLLDSVDSDVGQLQFVILFNFDQFVTRGRQTLLYRLLNASRSVPLFVLCVSSRQDCIELLEKRVRSRFSNICISFAQSSMTFDDFLKAFAIFLHTNAKKYGRHNALVKAFIEDENVQHKLREVYDEARSYSVLKQITATFLCFMDAEHVESLSSPHASQIFVEAKNAVLTNEDTMKSIVLSYRKLVNTYLPALNVKDDLILLKELDSLCSLTVLEEREQCGQLAFRRTSLQIDIDLVLNCLKEFTPLPTAIMHWLDDLEK